MLRSSDNDLITPMMATDETKDQKSRNDGPKINAMDFQINHK